MRVAAIVQARLGSTRLPAKILLPLPTGRTVIEEVLHRCAKINGVDVVVVAIPDTVENDVLADIIHPMTYEVQWLGGKRLVMVRGPEHDVLARYVVAAEAVSADVIMRITADCPLIDPDVCAKVLREVTEGRADYASNVERRSYPQGFDCQVATRSTFDWANENATEPYDKEHVFTILERLHAPQLGYRRVNVSESPDRSHIRWTLDTLADYRTIWNEFMRREKEAA